MSRFRLIAADLDGTLLDPSGALSPRTLAALRAADAAGVVTVLATARRYTGAEPIARAIGAVGAVIIFDGAQTRRFPDGEILETARLDAGQGQRVAEIMFGHGLRPIAQHSDGDGERLIVGPQADTPDWSQAYLNAVAPQVMPSNLADICTGRPDPVRVVAFGPAPRVSHVAHLIVSHPALADARSPNAVDAHVLDAGNYGTAELTVLPVGVSKGDALTRVSRRFGIPMQQVLALGDGLNDVSMFQVAGFSIAMGNATPALARIAHATTGSNGEDGAAQAIERYVLGGAG